MRLALALLLAAAPVKTSRSAIVAAAPDGFALSQSDDALFARGPAGLFSARAAADPFAECVGHAKFQAQATGHSLRSAADVALPFARACVADFVTADGEVMHELRWKLSPTLNVTVRCLPYDAHTADACLRFAASVRATRPASKAGPSLRH